MVIKYKQCFHEQGSLLIIVIYQSVLQISFSRKLTNNDPKRLQKIKITKANNLIPFKITTKKLILSCAKTPGDWVD